MSGSDAMAFLDYIKEEGRPGLVSFIGNAYQARMEEHAVTIFFDRTHANLIPMLRSAGQQGHLKELAAAYFKYSPEIHFAIGSDPKVVARIKEEEESMKIIREHPTIQYLLEKLNARIINCQIMDPKE